MLLHIKHFDLNKFFNCFFDVLLKNITIITIQWWTKSIQGTVSEVRLFFPRIVSTKSAFIPQIWIPRIGIPIRSTNLNYLIMLLMNVFPSNNNLWWSSRTLSNMTSVPLSLVQVQQICRLQYSPKSQIYLST